MDETVKTEISDDMSLVKDEGIEAEFTELTDEGAEVENQQIEGQQVMDMQLGWGAIPFLEKERR